MRVAALLPSLWLAASLFPGFAADSSLDLAGTKNDRLLADYFREQTVAITSHCLADIRTLNDWQTRREEYRRQLFEMLGLWPLPQRTGLKPVVTGKLEREDFTVEKLYFEALPKLYVTANLYLPKHLEKPAPAILYVCGHSRVFTNGVSYGNKTAYQHHGIWFARNGYVCLMLDTLQLGEIEGVHHGTYTQGQWWWNSRGYTPAGVEAWFGIRALDYLCSRPEVDAARIGMTGRSGGGSYTWTVAALDERVKVAAPVAGMTDLQNQVVDGAIEGHCDCMFFLNYYRWDFPQVAALIAPRPLLIGNSDKDSIFPLDGVVRLYQRTKRIYQLYGQTNHLGLLITDGPHADTQDLQLPVFRWFNRFLKGEDPVIEMAARKMFEPAELKVFDRPPADQINTRIQETFVREPRNDCADKIQAARQGTSGPLLEELRKRAFAGWPDEPPAPSITLVDQPEKAGLADKSYQIATQPDAAITMHLCQFRKLGKPDHILLTVLGSGSSTNLQIPQAERALVAFLAPRGVLSSPWMGNPNKVTQIRRRYMLLGQTLDSMRVWDIRCAVRALRSLPELRRLPIYVRAEGPMAVNAAYAALFEPDIARLELRRLPASQADGPDYLRVLQVWDIPQLREVLGSRLQVED
jgi:hypothetical protein